MPQAIPGAKGTPWYRKKVFLELAGSVPPLVAACIAAKRLLDDPATSTLGLWSIAAAAWLAVAIVIKLIAAYEQDRIESPRQEHEGLRAALHVLHASVTNVCGFAPDLSKQQLRVAFHRVVDPVDEPAQYEQVTDYIGGSGDGGKGRKFAVQCGISGRVIRTKMAYAQSRLNDDNASYERELVETWGFTEKDAKKVSKHCFSWMAVPICDLSRKHVIGVVYLDNTNKNVFDDPERQAAILLACAGIAEFIGERFQ